MQSPRDSSQRRFDSITPDSQSCHQHTPPWQERSKGSEDKSSLLDDSGCRYMNASSFSRGASVWPCHPSIRSCKRIIGPIRHRSTSTTYSSQNSQRLSGLLRREVLGKRLAARSGGNAARVLIRATTRAVMKAKLKQPSALQTAEGIRSMDPHPLTDDLREAPLATDPPTDTGENLGQRQGPMTPMDGPTEATRQPNRLSPRRNLRRPRYTGGRTRRRLTYWMCIFIFHNFFKIRSNTAPQQNLMASLRGGGHPEPRQEGAVLGKVDR